MLKAAFVTGLCVMIALPALAATDQEIAQKCVAGMRFQSDSGSELAFLPGGTVSGSKKTRNGMIAIHGTWQVKNGRLTYQTHSTSSYTSRFSHKIRLDGAGKCYMTTAKGERPIRK